jgi:hypothetical protein
MAKRRQLTVYFETPKGVQSTYVWATTKADAIRNGVTATFRGGAKLVDDRVVRAHREAVTVKIRVVEGWQPSTDRSAPEWEEPVEEGRFRVVLGDGAVVEVDGPILTFVGADGRREAVSRSTLGRRYSPSSEMGGALWTALEAHGITPPTIRGKSGGADRDNAALAAAGHALLSARVRPEAVKRLEELKTLWGRGKGAILTALIMGAPENRPEEME